MSTIESEIDAVLDPLARATLSAWDGHPSALRFVISQERPQNLVDNIHEVRPRCAVQRPSAVVIPLRRPVRLRPL